ncbi:unnamed protein product [Victoria cruziana]
MSLKSNNRVGKAFQSSQLRANDCRFCSMDGNGALLGLRGDTSMVLCKLDVTLPRKYGREDLGRMSGWTSSRDSP